MKRLACVLVPATAGVVAIGLAAGAASAGISGPCSATLAGANVARSGTGATSKAISVKHDAVVPIQMQAPSRLSHVKIVLSFAGISWTVKDESATTPLYAGTVPVKDYARYGVGLYKVTGRATGPGVSCSGSALVKVAGNPLASVAGIVGLVAAVLGAAGLAAGALGATGGVRPLRAVSSVVAGLIGAVGVLALLQQAGVLYPTALVAVVGLVLGAVLGVALPMLGRLVGHGPGTTVKTIPKIPHPA